MEARQQQVNHFCSSDAEKTELKKFCNRYAEEPFNLITQSKMLDTNLLEFNSSFHRPSRAKIVQKVNPKTKTLVPLHFGLVGVLEYVPLCAIVLDIKIFLSLSH